MHLGFKQLQLRGNLFLFRLHPGLLFARQEFEEFYNHGNGRGSGHAQITGCHWPTWNWSIQTDSLLKKRLEFIYPGNYKLSLNDEGEFYVVLLLVNLSKAGRTDVHLPLRRIAEVKHLATPLSVYK